MALVVNAPAVDLGESDLHTGGLIVHHISNGQLLLVRSLSSGKLTDNFVALELLMVDPGEGGLVWRRREGVSGGFFGCDRGHWLSPDGRSLACLARVRSGRLPEDLSLSLRVVDVLRWQLDGEVALPFTLPVSDDEIETGWVSDEFVYAADGKYLYYVRPDKDPAVIKVDLAKPAIVGELTLPPTQAGHGEPTQPGPVRRLLASMSRLLAPRVEAKGGVPLDVAAFLSQDGRRLYFTGGRKVELFTDALGQERKVRGDGIWVVDTEHMAVIAHFAAGREFFGSDTVLMSPDRRRIYAMDAVTHSLTVLDAETGAEIALLADIGDSPWSIHAVVPAAP